MTNHWENLQRNGLVDLANEGLSIKYFLLSNAEFNILSSINASKYYDFYKFGMK